MYPDETEWTENKEGNLEKRFHCRICPCKMTVTITEEEFKNEHKRLAGIDFALKKMGESGCPHARRQLNN